ncbi:hypothetical protein D9758_013161 [Tetrapyrgos nigripes]|uniref:N-acetyltransferase domain-containing protein n=1 Tax=Tetrapyrgos nigripes TaxID=182062 RepID=A0A8H5CEN1_9AGAR|nr:hypothetical protein D9758_013161 [Tetrapyrgos nigripes]
MLRAAFASASQKHQLGPFLNTNLAIPAMTSSNTTLAAAAERDNFHFPIPDCLENDKPSEHADKVAASSKDKSLWTYFPHGPFKDGADFIERFWNTVFRGNPSQFFFVVFDKTKRQESQDGNGNFKLAAIMGYILTSEWDLWTEIGAVIVFPEFQRTHVASNAVGLLLHYALDLPEEGGLGLRRVQWRAMESNAGSIRLARRFGFQMEGVTRWARVLQPGEETVTNGRPERRGDPRPGLGGTDIAVLAMCWDDWENGGREKVDAEMNRTK